MRVTYVSLISILPLKLPYIPNAWWPLIFALVRVGLFAPNPRKTFIPLAAVSLILLLEAQFWLALLFRFWFPLLVLGIPPPWKIGFCQPHCAYFP